MGQPDERDALAAQIAALRAAGLRLIGAVEACAVAVRGGPPVNWKAVDESQDAMRDALKAPFAQVRSEGP